METPIGLDIGSFEDTWNELRYCIPDELLHAARDVILNMRREQVQLEFVDGFQEHWIPRLIQSLPAGENFNKWLCEAVDNENYGHPLKTEERMDSIRYHSYIT